MKIEVWSDFSCPYCYLGKKRFEKALNRYEHKEQIEVVYKAYQLNPHAPKVMDGTAAANFAASHGISEAQANERFASVTKAAAQEGLTYRYDIMQMTKTFDAHRLAKWARKFGLETALTERLMKAYFTDGLNIADHETLVFLAKGVGLDPDVAQAVLASSQYANVVFEEQAEARQIGVQGVPFFVMNRTYGVSGAQSEAYFLQVLDHLWTENATKGRQEEATGTEYCDEEGCRIE
ncbi:MAG: DsbA family oxidoreductase [Bacilli bacterium]|jgi:predicted DsbA family dithiol-disulfide isomerase